MVAIGTRMDKDMTAVLTRMDQPLGRSAGNAVEIAETVASLKGEGPADLMEVTRFLAANMLVMAGRSASAAAAETVLDEQIASGAALERFRRMVEYHGGDARFIEDPSRLPQASIRHPYNPGVAGYVRRVDAGKIGRACVALGAGRRAVTDPVDHAVGITGIVKIGEQLEKDEPAFEVLANGREQLAAALELLDGAVEVASEPPELQPLIGMTIDENANDE
jgi:thymidine phosphorylase